MILLVHKGIGRQKAHELLRVLSGKAITSGRHLKEVLMADEMVQGLLSEDEIDKALDAEHYIGEAKKLVDMTIERLTDDTAKEQ